MKREVVDRVGVQIGELDLPPALLKRNPADCAQSVQQSGCCRIPAIVRAASRFTIDVKPASSSYRLPRSRQSP